MSSTVATDAANRLKNCCNQPLLGGKQKTIICLPETNRNSRAIPQYLFNPNGCTMQSKLESIQGVGTCTWTLWLLGGCCSKTSPPAVWGAWRKEQLPLHMSEWKFWLFIRKITAGVTKGLLIMTPKWSSNFLISLATNKRYCSVCTWGAKGMPKFSSKISNYEKQHRRRIIHGTHNPITVMHKTHGKKGLAIWHGNGFLSFSILGWLSWWIWYKTKLYKPMSQIACICVSFFWVLNIHIPAYLGSRRKPFAWTSKFFCMFSSCCNYINLYKFCELPNFYFGSLWISILCCWHSLVWCDTASLWRFSQSSATWMRRCILTDGVFLFHHCLLWYLLVIILLSLIKLTTNHLHLSHSHMNNWLERTRVYDFVFYV